MNGRKEIIVRVCAKRKMLRFLKLVEIKIDIIHQSQITGKGREMRSLYLFTNILLSLSRFIFHVHVIFSAPQDFFFFIFSILIVVVIALKFFFFLLHKTQ